jgi:hypothetical protein
LPIASNTLVTARATFVGDDERRGVELTGAPERGTAGCRHAPGDPVVRLRCRLAPNLLTSRAIYSCTARYAQLCDLGLRLEIKSSSPGPVKNTHFNSRAQAGYKASTAGACGSTTSQPQKGACGQNSTAPVGPSWRHLAELIGALDPPAVTSVSAPNTRSLIFVHGEVGPGVRPVLGQFSPERARAQGGLGSSRFQAGFRPTGSTSGARGRPMERRPRRAKSRLKSWYAP